MRNDNWRRWLVLWTIFMNALVDSSVTSILEHSVAQQKKNFNLFEDMNLDTNVRSKSLFDGQFNL